MSRRRHNLPDQVIGLLPFAVMPAIVVCMAALSSCGQTAAIPPTVAAAPAVSQEPGFSAFCSAHPGKGTCP